MAITTKAMILAAGTASGSSLMLAVLEQFPEYTPLAAIAGLMGGACRWIGKRQRWWPDGLGSILAGVMCAVAIWPMGQWLVGGKVAELQMDPKTAVLFGGFVVGVSALSIVGLIMDTGERRRRRAREDDDA